MLRRGKAIRRESDADGSGRRANYVRGANHRRTGGNTEPGGVTTKPLLIGKLAASAGIKTDSVRFYERSGLLPKPQRSANGYRVYDQSAVTQLRFIKRAQSLGFSLDEVRRILHLKGQGRTTCRSVMRMAEATLEETETKLRNLQNFGDSLAANVTRWRKLPAQRKCAAEFCDLIESSGETPRST